MIVVAVFSPTRHTRRPASLPPLIIPLRLIFPSILWLPYHYHEILFPVILLFYILLAVYIAICHFTLLCPLIGSPFSIILQVLVPPWMNQSRKAEAGKMRSLSLNRAMVCNFYKVQLQQGARPLRLYSRL